MKREDFRECPLCGGPIEHKRDVLHHPIRGNLPHIPYAVCQQCGEIFLGRDSYEAMHEAEAHQPEHA